MPRSGLIAVGKIRAVHWRAAYEHYLKLLSRWRPVDVAEVRDCQGERGVQREGEEILRRLSARDCVVALHDKGSPMSSSRFAQFLRDCDECIKQRPVFILGGPWGLAPDVLQRASLTLSLSPMIFPHELARVMLLEQLYRAESILRHTAYHHE